MKKILSGNGTVRQEQALLAIGAVLILIHSVDDGIALGAFDIAPSAITAVALLTAALYRWLPWFVFVLIALFVGVTRLGGGIGHLISLPDPDPGDYTGIFEAVGALIFLGIAVGVVRRFARDNMGQSPLFQTLKGRGTPEQERLYLGISALMVTIHAVHDVIAEGSADPVPLIVTAVGILTAALHLVLPWPVSVVAALLVGIAHVYWGVLHMVEIVEPENHSAYSGPVQVLGALLFIALAVAIARRQKEPSAIEPDPTKPGRAPDAS